MGKGHLCMLFLALFMILASLAVTLTSIVTDNWFSVDASNQANTTIRNEFSYNFGMWRKCYKYDFPADVPVDRITYKCAYTYQDLLPRVMPTDSSDVRYLHMERSWLGCMIAGAAVQIFAILTLICGLWPAECNNANRSSLYLAASILCLLAAMCGIASGICFIALRDIDLNSRNLYPDDNISTRYGYSFMLGWVGNSLCILEGFVFLCLLKMDYNDVNESGKYSNLTF